jgi:hypothetical protein
MKIAAPVGDAFQEEEFFLPKLALREAGHTIEWFRWRPSLEGAARKVFKLTT